MDFIIRTKEFLESELDLGASIEPASLSPEGRSIAIREAPGTIAQSYQNGENYNLNFQILARDSDFIGVTNLIHMITKKLNRLPNDSIVSQDGSFIFVTCRVTTLPNYVEKTNEGYIFTALFNAELEI